MTTKAAVVATVGILAGAIVLGLAAVLLLGDTTAPDAAARAALLGQVVALLCLVPLGAVWFVWAAGRREKHRRDRSGRRDR